MAVSDILKEPQSRRRFIAIGLAGGAAAALAACGGAAQAAKPASAPASSQPPAAPRTSELYLTVVTGKQIDKKDFPAFVPSDFTVPANSLVKVTVTNFDDETPLAAGQDQFAKVSGTVGNTITIQPLTGSDPNGSGTPTTVSELDPKKVSHTLTFADLKINVPIAPAAKTIFQIKTGAPGVHQWHCMDPCGSGTAGWGAAMAATDGYMEGKMTVA